MATYAVINDSSSAPSSSRFHQATEKEGEDGDCLRVETRISDLNQHCQGLGHEVCRLSIENVENDEILESLKRRIEEFNHSESRLSSEIEQLEQKILMLILEKGLKDGKLEKFGVGDEFGDMKQNKLEQKLLNLVVEIENKREKFEGFEKGEILREFDNDLDPRRLDEFGKMGGVNDEVDWSDDDDDVRNEIKEVKVSDNDGGEEEEGEGIGEIGAHELFKEIELLEAMLERGSLGLLDVKMMMEEVEALEGPEEMMNEMDVKMGELESGLWELKSAVEELKSKKSKELMGLVSKEIEELQRDGKEEVNARKLNWGSVMASIGAVAVAAAIAMVFKGRTRVNAAEDRKNKQRTG